MGMDYDFAVIGGGSAGYAAARTAAALGLKTVVVEGGAEVGGLCILRGCMPSKTLIESANRMRTLRRAEEFGLRATGLEAHAEEIVARKRRLIGGFADYRREQLETGKFDFIRGRARFVDPHTVEIEWPGETSRTLRARSFLVATGSVVSQPPLPGLAECGAITSDEALELEALPTSLAVLGAGPVALELAHYFSALGTKVTLLQRGPQLLTRNDPDLAGALEKAMRESGITIFTSTKITTIECDAHGKRITFEHGGKPQSIECAQILNALGRHPNLDKLGLDAAKVEQSHGKIGTNAHQQTSQPHIFAAGDCCGPFEVVHIAVQQGEVAARNAARVLGAGDALESVDHRLKLFAVFTEPQLATVGLNEEEAREKGIAFRTAKYPFDDHGKSVVMGEPHGFVKLMTDARTGEIIGGSVVGPHASDLIHEIVVAMNFRATAAQLAAIPHYHPTLSEIWTYPAEELAG
jgi:pyruvate/2-oxoglutarate dehydrogenase complex dihydrolipoamide dehydrogenase (E3) component